MIGVRSVSDLNQTFDTNEDATKIRLQGYTRRQIKSGLGFMFMLSIFI
jgi:hypothetical protein